MATSDEWILQRTGIRERHMAEKGEGTSDLAKPAALEAIREAGLTPADIGFIVVGTTTPDTIFPSTACTLQAKIGAVNAWGFDLGAACSGFTYSMSVAYQMVATGSCNHALVVGGDVMSSIIDYTDRATCVLFGDGAGAVVLSPAAPGEPSIIDFCNITDGTGGPSLQMPAGGSRMPASHETVDQRLHYVKQDGSAVFKFAVRMTEEISLRILERNNLTGADLDLFVSHQANRRIIDAAAIAARPRPGQGRHQSGTLRQHHRRHHPARARRRAPRRQTQEGRPRAARVSGRGIYGGIDAVAMGIIDGANRQIDRLTD